MFLHAFQHVNQFKLLLFSLPDRCDERMLQQLFGTLPFAGNFTKASVYKISQLIGSMS